MQSDDDLIMNPFETKSKILQTSVKSLNDSQRENILELKKKISSMISAKKLTDYILRKDFQPSMMLKMLYIIMKIR